MKSSISRITSGAFAVGMLVGVSACVQLFDRGPDIKVRSVAKMQGDKTSPDSEYYLSAVSAINGRDYATALEYLQAARAKEPENIHVLNAFGVVYDKLGRFDLSARYYAQASALDPKSSIVAKNIAYSRALQGISAPDASQVASAETPPGAAVRVTDARAIPAAVVIAPAAPSTPLLNASTGVTATTQSSASGAPTRPAATIAVIPVKPAAAIVPPSLSSTHPAPREVTPIVKVAISAAPVPALPAHFSVTPAVANKAVAPSFKAENPETPISPVVSRGAAIAKSFTPDIPARSSAATVAKLPPKPAVSTAPKPPALPSAAASIARMVMPASFKSVSPTHPSAIPAIAAKAVAGPKAEASKTILLTGFPLIVTDASGTRDAVQAVRNNLAMLGWTISHAAAPNIRSQNESILFYPPANLAAAHALARTLPFPVRMTVNQCHCGGLQLMVGSSVPSWKNVHRYSPSLRPKALSVAAISNTTRMGVR